MQENKFSSICATYIAVFLLFCTPPLFSLSVSSPSETAQGDFITIYFYTKRKPAMAYVELIAEDGSVVQKVSAFPIDRKKKNAVALLGIPVWIEPGTYYVKATATENKKFKTIESELIIRKTDFTEYTLYLDAKNTDIISKPDPQKTEESKILSEILTTFNPDAPPFAQKFQKPNLLKRITSKFGEKRKVIYNTGKKSSEIHYGIDCGIPQGTELIAPADGTVIFAGNRIVTGGTLIVENAPGVYTIFYHLSKVLKSVGEKVTAGETVALSGNTGYSTGPHLHWEFRINAIPVNPFSAVERPLFIREEH